MIKRLFGLLVICFVVTSLPILPAARAQDGCTAALAGRLIVNAEGRVLFTDGQPLNTRSEPGLNAYRNGQLAEGSEFLVMEGPVCAEGIHWWRVASQQASGWIAEGVAGVYYVEPALGTFDASTYLPPDSVLAFRLADGTTAYANVALHPVAALPSTPRPSAPRNDRLVGVMTSPDGARIAWLFDQTEVEPSMVTDCEAENGCIGRVYALVVTDADGGNPRTLWEPVIGEFYPNLRLLGWREDSGAIWLRQLPWGVASPHYLPMGGGLFEVTVPPGDTPPVVTQRSQDYLATDAVLSPDGHWLAESSGNITVTRDDNVAWEVRELQSDLPASSQFTWSPGSDRLAWIDLYMRRGSFDPEGFALSVAEPATQTVRQPFVFAPIPDALTLPMTGPWLTDGVLSFSYGGAVWLVDVVNNTAGIWLSALAGQPVAQFVGIQQ